MNAPLLTALRSFRFSALTLALTLSSSIGWAAPVPAVADPFDAMQPVMPLSSVDPLTRRAASTSQSSTTQSAPAATASAAASRAVAVVPVPSNQTSTATIRPLVPAGTGQATVATTATRSTDPLTANPAQPRSGTSQTATDLTLRSSVTSLPQGTITSVEVGPGPNQEGVTRVTQSAPAGSRQGVPVATVTSPSGQSTVVAVTQASPATRTSNTTTATATGAVTQVQVRPTPAYSPPVIRDNTTLTAPLATTPSSRAPLVITPPAIPGLPAGTPATSGAMGSGAMGSGSVNSGSVNSGLMAPATSAGFPDSTASQLTTTAPAESAAAPRIMIPLTQVMPVKPTRSKTAKGKSSRSRAAVAAASGPIEQVDVTEIDKQISNLAANAQHYPPRFPDRNSRDRAEVLARQLIDQLDGWAVVPNASYEVLLRAGKANSIGRNLDLGTTAILKSSVYLKRAIELRPNDGEANFWYGSVLAEGGGFKEGVPYLNKSLAAGYDEALLSLANVYLNTEKNDQALAMIERYRAKFPDDPRLNGMVEAVNSGKASIW